MMPSVVKCICTLSYQSLLIYFEHDVCLKRLEIVAKRRRHAGSAEVTSQELFKNLCLQPFQKDKKTPCSKYIRRMYSGEYKCTGEWKALLQ